MTAVGGTRRVEVRRSENKKCALARLRRLRTRDRDRGAVERARAWERGRRRGARFVDYNQRRRRRRRSSSLADCGSRASGVAVSARISATAA